MSSWASELDGWLQLVSGRRTVQPSGARGSGLEATTAVNKAADRAVQWLAISSNRGVLHSWAGGTGSQSIKLTWDSVCCDFITRALRDVTSLTSVHVTATGQLRLDAGRKAALAHVESVLGWAHEWGPVLSTAPLLLIDFARAVVSSDVTRLVAGKLALRLVRDHVCTQPLYLLRAAGRPDTGMPSRSAHSSRSPLAVRIEECVTALVKASVCSPIPAAVQQGVGVGGKQHASLLEKLQGSGPGGASRLEIDPKCTRTATSIVSELAPTSAECLGLVRALLAVCPDQDPADHALATPLVAMEPLLDRLARWMSHSGRDSPSLSCSGHAVTSWGGGRVTPRELVRGVGGGEGEGTVHTVPAPPCARVNGLTEPAPALPGQPIPLPPLMIGRPATAFWMEVESLLSFAMGKVGVAVEEAATGTSAGAAAAGAGHSLCLSKLGPFLSYTCMGSVASQLWRERRSRAVTARLLCTALAVTRGGHCLAAAGQGSDGKGSCPARPFPQGSRGASACALPPHLHAHGAAHAESVAAALLGTHYCSYDGRPGSGSAPLPAPHAYATPTPRLSASLPLPMDVIFPSLLRLAPGMLSPSWLGECTSREEGGSGLGMGIGDKTGTDRADLSAPWPIAGSPLALAGECLYIAHAAATAFAVSNRDGDGDGEGLLSYAGYPSSLSSPDSPHLILPRLMAQIHSACALYGEGEGSEDMPGLAFAGPATTPVQPVGTPSIAPPLRPVDLADRLELLGACLSLHPDLVPRGDPMAGLVRDCAQLLGGIGRSKRLEEGLLTAALRLCLLAVSLPALGCSEVGAGGSSVVAVQAGEEALRAWAKGLGTCTEGQGHHPAGPDSFWRAARPLPLPLFSAHACAGDVLPGLQGARAVSARVSTSAGLRTALASAVARESCAWTLLAQVLLHGVVPLLHSEAGKTDALAGMATRLLSSLLCMGRVGGGGEGEGEGEVVGCDEQAVTQSDLAPAPLPVPWARCVLVRACDVPCPWVDLGRPLPYPGTERGRPPCLLPSLLIDVMLCAPLLGAGGGRAPPCVPKWDVQASGTGSDPTPPWSLHDTAAIPALAGVELLAVLAALLPQRAWAVTGGDGGGEGTPSLPLSSATLVLRGRYDLYDGAPLSAPLLTTSLSCLARTLSCPGGALLSWACTVLSSLHEEGRMWSARRGECAVTAGPTLAAAIGLLLCRLHGVGVAFRLGRGEGEGGAGGQDASCVWVGAGGYAVRVCGSYPGASFLPYAGQGQEGGAGREASLSDWRLGCRPSVHVWSARAGGGAVHVPATLPALTCIAALRVPPHPQPTGYTAMHQLAPVSLAYDSSAGASSLRACAAIALSSFARTSASIMGIAPLWPCLLGMGCVSDGRTIEGLPPMACISMGQGSVSDERGSAAAVLTAALVARHAPCPSPYHLQRAALMVAAVIATAPALAPLHGVVACTRCLVAGLTAYLALYTRPWLERCVGGGADPPPPPLPLSRLYTSEGEGGGEGEPARAVQGTGRGRAEHGPARAVALLHSLRCAAQGVAGATAKPCGSALHIPSLARALSVPLFTLDTRPSCTPIPDVSLACMVTLQASCALLLQGPSFGDLASAIPALEQQHYCESLTLGLSDEHDARALDIRTALLEAADTIVHDYAHAAVPLAPATQSVGAGEGGRAGGKRKAAVSHTVRLMTATSAAPHTHANGAKANRVAGQDDDDMSYTGGEDEGRKRGARVSFSQFAVQATFTSDGDGPASRAQLHAAESADMIVIDVDEEEELGGGFSTLSNLVHRARVQGHGLPTSSSVRSGSVGVARAGRSKSAYRPHGPSLARLSSGDGEGRRVRAGDGQGPTQERRSKAGSMDLTDDEDEEDGDGDGGVGGEAVHTGPEEDKGEGDTQASGWGGPTLSTRMLVEAALWAEMDNVAVLLIDVTALCTPAAVAGARHMHVSSHAYRKAVLERWGVGGQACTPLPYALSTSLSVLTRGLGWRTDTAGRLDAALAPLHSGSSSTTVLTPRLPDMMRAFCHVSSAELPAAHMAAAVAAVAIQAHACAHGWQPMPVPGTTSHIASSAVSVAEAMCIASTRACIAIVGRLAQAETVCRLGAITGVGSARTIGVDHVYTTIACQAVGEVIRQAEWVGEQLTLGSGPNSLPCAPNAPTDRLTREGYASTLWTTTVGGADPYIHPRVYVELPGLGRKGEGVDTYDAVPWGAAFLHTPEQGSDGDGGDQPYSATTLAVIVTAILWHGSGAAGAGLPARHVASTLALALPLLTSVPEQALGLAFTLLTAHRNLPGPASSHRSALPPSEDWLLSFLLETGLHCAAGGGAGRGHTSSVAVQGMAHFARVISIDTRGRDVYATGWRPGYQDGLKLGLPLPALPGMGEEEAPSYLSCTTGLALLECWARECGPEANAALLHLLLRAGPSSSPYARAVHAALCRVAVGRGYSAVQTLVRDSMPVLAELWLGSGASLSAFPSHLAGYPTMAALLAQPSVGEGAWVVAAITVSAARRVGVSLGKGKGEGEKDPSPLAALTSAALLARSELGVDSGLARCEQGQASAVARDSGPGCGLVRIMESRGQGNFTWQPGAVLGDLPPRAPAGCVEDAICGPLAELLQLVKCAGGEGQDGPAEARVARLVRRQAGPILCVALTLLGHEPGTGSEGGVGGNPMLVPHLLGAAVLMTAMESVAHGGEGEGAHTGKQVRAPMPAAHALRVLCREHGSSTGQAAAWLARAVAMGAAPHAEAGTVLEKALHETSALDRVSLSLHRAAGGAAAVTPHQGLTALCVACPNALPILLVSIRGHAVLLFSRIHILVSSHPRASAGMADTLEWTDCTASCKGLAATLHWLHPILVESFHVHSTGRVHMQAILALCTALLHGVAKVGAEGGPHVLECLQPVVAEACSLVTHLLTACLSAPIPIPDSGTPPSSPARAQGSLQAVLEACAACTTLHAVLLALAEVQRTTRLEEYAVLSLAAASAVCTALCAPVQAHGGVGMSMHTVLRPVARRVKNQAAAAQSTDWLRMKPATPELTPSVFDYSHAHLSAHLDDAVWAASDALQGCGPCVLGTQGRGHAFLPHAVALPAMLSVVRLAHVLGAALGQAQSCTAGTGRADSLPYILCSDMSEGGRGGAPVVPPPMPLLLRALRILAAGCACAEEEEEARLGVQDGGGGRAAVTTGHPLLVVRARECLASLDKVSDMARAWGEGEGEGRLDRPHSVEAASASPPAQSDPGSPFSHTHEGWGRGPFREPVAGILRVFPTLPPPSPDAPTLASTLTLSHTRLLSMAPYAAYAGATDGLPRDREGGTVGGGWDGGAYHPCRSLLEVLTLPACLSSFEGLAALLLSSTDGPAPRASMLGGVPLAPLHMPMLYVRVRAMGLLAECTRAAEWDCTRTCPPALEGTGCPSSDPWLVFAHACAAVLQAKEQDWECLPLAYRALLLRASEVVTVPPTSHVNPQANDGDVGGGQGVQGLLLQRSMAGSVHGQLPTPVLAYLLAHDVTRDTVLQCIATSALHSARPHATCCLSDAMLPLLIMAGLHEGGTQALVHGLREAGMKVRGAGGLGDKPGTRATFGMRGLAGEVGTGQLAFGRQAALQPHLASSLGWSSLLKAEKRCGAYAYWHGEGKGGRVHLPAIADLLSTLVHSALTAGAPWAASCLTLLRAVRWAHVRMSVSAVALRQGEEESTADEGLSMGMGDVVVPVSPSCTRPSVSAWTGVPLRPARYEVLAHDWCETQRGEKVEKRGDIQVLGLPYGSRVVCLKVGRNGDGKRKAVVTWDIAYCESPGEIASVTALASRLVSSFPTHAYLLALGHAGEDAMGRVERQADTRAAKGGGAEEYDRDSPADRIIAPAVLSLLAFDRAQAAVLHAAPDSSGTDEVQGHWPGPLALQYGLDLDYAELAAHFIERGTGRGLHTASQLLHAACCASNTVSWASTAAPTLAAQGLVSISDATSARSSEMGNGLGAHNEAGAGEEGPSRGLLARLILHLYTAPGYSDEDAAYGIAGESGLSPLPTVCIGSSSRAVSSVAHLLSPVGVAAALARHRGDWASEGVLLRGAASSARAALGGRSLAGTSLAHGLSSWTASPLLAAMQAGSGLGVESLPVPKGGDKDNGTAVLARSIAPLVGAPHTAPPFPPLPVLHPTTLVLLSALPRAAALPTVPHPAVLLSHRLVQAYTDPILACGEDEVPAHPSTVDVPSMLFVRAQCPPSTRTKAGSLGVAGKGAGADSSLFAIGSVVRACAALRRTSRMAVVRDLIRRNRLPQALLALERTGEGDGDGEVGVLTHTEDRTASILASVQGWEGKGSDCECRASLAWAGGDAGAAIRGLQGAAYAYVRAAGLAWRGHEQGPPSQGEGGGLVGHSRAWAMLMVSALASKACACLTQTATWLDSAGMDHPLPSRHAGDVEAALGPGLSRLSRVLSALRAMLPPPSPTRSGTATGVEVEGGVGQGTEEDEEEGEGGGHMPVYLRFKRAGEEGVMDSRLFLRAAVALAEAIPRGPLVPGSAPVPGSAGVGAGKGVKGKESSVPSSSSAPPSPFPHPSLHSRAVSRALSARAHLALARATDKAAEALHAELSTPEALRECAALEGRRAAQTRLQALYDAVSIRVRELYSEAAGAVQGAARAAGTYEARKAEIKGKGAPIDWLSEEKVLELDRKALGAIAGPVLGQGHPAILSKSALSLIVREAKSQLVEDEEEAGRRLNALKSHRSASVRSYTAFLRARADMCLESAAHGLCLRRAGMGEDDARADAGSEGTVALRLVSLLFFAATAEEEVDKRGRGGRGDRAPSPRLSSPLAAQATLLQEMGDALSSLPPHALLPALAQLVSRLEDSGGEGSGARATDLPSPSILDSMPGSGGGGGGAKRNELTLMSSRAASLQEWASKASWSFQGLLRLLIVRCFLAAPHRTSLHLLALDRLGRVRWLGAGAAEAIAAGRAASRSTSSGKARAAADLLAYVSSLSPRLARLTASMRLLHDVYCSAGSRGPDPAVQEARPARVFQWRGIALQTGSGPIKDCRLGGPDFPWPATRDPNASVPAPALSKSTSIGQGQAYVAPESVAEGTPLSFLAEDWAVSLCRDMAVVTVETLLDPAPTRAWALVDAARHGRAGREARETGDGEWEQDSWRTLLSSLAHAGSEGAGPHADPVDPYLLHAHVTGLGRGFNQVAEGLHAPRKLVAQASDGRSYPQLLKGGYMHGARSRTNAGQLPDDPRQDAAVQALFRTANALLDQDPHASRRGLHMRTFRVVPLTPTTGLLQWIPGCLDVKAWVDAPPWSGHARYRPGEWNSAQCRAHMEEGRAAWCAGIARGKAGPAPMGKAAAAGPAFFSHQAGGDEDPRRAAFHEVMDRHSPVLQYWHGEVTPDPQAWAVHVQTYARSTAVSTILTYLAGCGDRHPGNVLLCPADGSVLHIDFGMMFDSSRFLPIPERVPTRLTRNTASACGPSALRGSFEGSAGVALRVMRAGAEPLVQHLAVLLADPLVKWQAGHTAEGGDSAVVAARASLDRVRDKLGGGMDGGGSALPERAQLARIIAESQSSALLCQMFAGWAPWT